MTEAAIQRLRRLQGLGIVTPPHCIRAERYVERHPEIFSDPTSMTVSEAVDLAVESATLTTLDVRYRFTVFLFYRATRGINAQRDLRPPQAAALAWDGQ